MPAFAYQALDGAGKTQRGVLQGDTARAVRQTLRERGLNPLEVAPVETQRESAAFGRRGLSPTQLALFTRQLATLLAAGLPIDEALAALSEEGEDERPRALTAALRARVLEGAGLAIALAEHPESFPEIYRASVAAGESSGRLDTVLERLADYAESRDALRQQALTALAYPLLLLVVAVAVVTGLLVYVVPQIVGVFTNLHQALPLPTRLLIALSEFVKAYGWLVAIGLALGAIGLRIALRRGRVKATWHRLVLRLPLAGRLVRAANTARAARTLALLTASAVPLLDALTIAAQVVPNLPMREALRRIQSGEFAREWIDENASGCKNFLRLREETASHPVEKVGAELRKMMAWIK